MAVTGKKYIHMYNIIFFPLYTLTGKSIYTCIINYNIFSTYTVTEKCVYTCII